MSLKLAVIIPDRGDRPDFMDNCVTQIMRQTIDLYFVIVNFPPESNEIDITKRYREGYEEVRGKGYDLIAFMENDDAYAPNYLEYMTNAWVANGKPDLFGTTYTHYYHIKLQQYFTMHHHQRSSMMNTFIKPDLDFKWCADNIAYADMHLWDNCTQLTKALVTPDPPISLGIKHGFGLCGGQSHTDKLDLYYGPRGRQDEGATLLKSVCDVPSFNFYNSFYDPAFKKRICG